MTNTPIKLIGTTYGKFTSIQERLLNSYLEFVFYESGLNVTKRRILPFLGDVNISESRKANYIDYVPVSRNSALSFYTGSDSRIFKVVYEISPNFLLQNDGFVNYIKGFRDISDLGSQGSENPKANFFPDPQKPNDPQFTFNRPYGSYVLSEKGIVPTDLSNDKLVYGFVDYQVNLIRFSVVNKATDPTKGPPLVRLNHGLLYQNIPCICKDYSIEQIYDDSNKKNIHTKYKISKYKLQINITLQEIRTGNYLQTKFDPTNPDSKDNIVGWEQLFDDTKPNKSQDPISPVYK
jgi:hypothetical protein